MSSLFDDDGAIISGDGVWRFRLWRTWDRSKPRLLWVMLNPSTADAENNDPTLRKIIAFSSAWGYGGLEVVNLCPFRSAIPDGRGWAEMVKGHPSAWHWNVDEWSKGSRQCQDIVAAWGAGPKYLSGSGFVFTQSMFEEAVKAAVNYFGTMDCLGWTKAGHPRHPLYMANVTERQRYCQIGSKMPIPALAERCDEE